ncbi:hypothetical protein C8Q78DRAFT_207112 [Trametes maxima]|nr:hypothetical protein C8Q78DRAFT_207112 [Trametes maxima]
MHLSTPIVSAMIPASGGPRAFDDVNSQCSALLRRRGKREHSRFSWGRFQPTQFGSTSVVCARKLAGQTTTRLLAALIQQDEAHRWCWLGVRRPYA